MDIEYIKKELQLIADCAGDFEAAHGMEDSLMMGFIDHIASLGLGELSEMARLIQTSQEIDFPRYCA